MTGLARLPDWRKRLDDYLDGLEGKAFDWATMSCGLFAADAVRAMTGIDFSPEFRGQVQDDESAAAALKAAGYDTIAELAAAKLEECPLSALRLGDIASVVLSSGPTLYLVNSPPLSLLGMGRRGKVTLPISKASRGFRVG